MKNNLSYSIESYFLLLICTLFFGIGLPILFNENNIGYGMVILNFSTLLIAIFYYLSCSKQTIKVLTSFKIIHLKPLFYGLQMLFSLVVIFTFLIVLNNYLLFFDTPKHRINPNLFLFFYSVFLAPIIEEFYFRKIILGNLLLKFNPFISLLVSSLLFSLIHFSVPQIIYTFFLGLVLGLLYYKTNNILVSILLHAFNNLIAVVITYYKFEKIIEKLDYEVLIFSIITLVFIFGFCVNKIIKYTR